MHVSPSNLDELIALQREILSQGVGSTTFAPLGNLLGLHVGPRGWHADGPARTRTFLRGALGVFVADEARAPDIGAHATHKAKALSHFFGISAPPLSAKKAAERLGEIDDVTEAPSGSSVYNWRSEFSANEAVLRWADREFISDGRMRDLPSATELKRISSARPVWSGSQSLWPPPTTWPDGIRELDQLLAGARRSLAGDPGNDEVTQLLREVVIAELQGTYFSHNDWTKQYRHVRAKMSESWFRTDDFYFAEPAVTEAPEATSSTFKKQVAAITQMMFHDAAGSGALAKSLAALAAERESAQGMELHVAQSVLSDRIGAEPRPLTADESRIRRTFSSNPVGDFDVTSYREHGPGGGTWSNADAVVDLYKRSNFIRKAPKDVAIQLAHDYVAERKKVNWDTINFADVIWLELADQSVSLDVARFNEGDLVKEMGMIVAAAAPTPQGAAYLTLMHRDRSLIETKHGNSRAAIASIFRGFSDLAYLQENGLVEPRAAKEAGHQLALRGSGAYTQVIEAQLRSVPEKRALDPRLQRWSRNALLLSHETRLRLDELEFEGRGLATARHDDGYISAVAWRVQTQVINLRARLAVHTAVHSHLCAKPVPPPGPREANSFNIGLHHIGELYHALISTKEVSAGDVNEIVKLGMWFGMLNGARLPVAENLAPALKDLGFMDIDPDDLTTDLVQERAVDLIASSAWLATRGHDSGILSYLPQNGPVFETLEKNRTLANWRAEFPLIVKRKGDSVGGPVGTAAKESSATLIL